VRCVIPAEQGVACSVVIGAGLTRRSSKHAILRHDRSHLGALKILSSGVAAVSAHALGGARGRMPSRSDRFGAVIGSAPSSPPEVLEPPRRQFRVAHSRLD
jgi:hypothetical protein